MCYGRFVLFFLLSAFIASIANAQQKTDWSFQHIDQQDGLLHNTVLGIAQDEKGFIWIVTKNGLQRYDGTRFLNFNEMLNDPSEPQPEGVSVYTDSKNHCLWVLKQNKLEKLDAQTKHFTVYEATTLLNNPALHFDKYTDGQGASWLLGERGLFFSDSAAQHFYWNGFNISPFNRHYNNYFAADSSSGNVWMSGGAAGLYLFDKKTKKLYNADYNPSAYPMLEAFKGKLGKGPAPARYIMADNNHNYWVTKWNDVFFRYNTTTQKLFTYSLSAITKKLPANNKVNNAQKIINSIFEDNHGTIWISTDHAGLLKYDAASDKFLPVLMDEKNNANRHYNYSVICIFQDREENIWLGTDKGITVFNPYRKYYSTIRYEANNTASLPKSEITACIQTHSGDILAGTWGAGITVYDSGWNYKKNIRFTGPDEYNLVWSFVQNDDGNIWAGCQHGYIHVYNPVSHAISTIHPPELENSTIVCMTKDRSGNIWMGLYNGKIAKWDKSRRVFYAGASADKKLSAVQYIFFDKAENCWVSTADGFKIFDTVKRLYSAVYLPDLRNPQAISGNTIEGIEQYSDSVLIIGTVYGGLNFFNIKTKTFSHLTAKEGLPSNTVYAIKKDSAGNIWFTTDYSLYKFLPPDKKFVRYHIESADITSSFNTVFFYAMSGGRWVSATQTEFICFRPGAAKQAGDLPAKVEIAGFKIFDEAVSIDSILAANKPVQLSYQQNFITIEFALLHFSAVQQTKYAYRLSGVNSDWVNGNKQFASYTNLEPGAYIFSVKADGENEPGNETSFKIIISPPFWNSRWFMIAMALAVILVAYVFIKGRIKSIKATEAEKQQAKIEMLGIKEKLSAAKLEALRSQMNPHFIFNCLNSIDNLIQNNDKEKATQYLSKFARLIRSILETSKSNLVPCWKDMETLQVYAELEELRMDKKFSYQINIAPEILNGDYKVPPLVIQPFVENAIHHGLFNKIDTGGKLLINVWAADNYIHYTIEDNGVGRAKAAMYKALNKPAHESMGMQISLDRINLFNQHHKNAVTITDLYDEDHQPAGTRVAVELINQ